MYYTLGLIPEDQEYGCNSLRYPPNATQKMLLWNVFSQNLHHDLSNIPLLISLAYWIDFWRNVFCALGSIGAANQRGIPAEKELASSEVNLRTVPRQADQLRPT
jgi:hypothetical protein